MPLLNGVWLLDPEGTPHQVPDNEGVIGYFKGRGYQVTDLPSHLDSDDEEFQAKLAELQDSGEAEIPPDVPEELAEDHPANEAPSETPRTHAVQVEPTGAESATTKKGK